MERLMESDTGNETFRYYAILNRRSIASIGMLPGEQTSGQAIQRTSQLERVWGVFGRRCTDKQATALNIAQ
jgi:hypothetical protein